MLFLLRFDPKEPGEYEHLLWEAFFNRIERFCRMGKRFGKPLVSHLAMVMIVVSMYVSKNMFQGIIPSRREVFPPSVA